MIANVLALLPFALFAAASSYGDQCNTGDIQCCDSSTSYSDAAPYFQELGLVDVVAVVDAFVGLSCSGVTVVGTSNGCTANQEPLCCEDNNYNGVVSLGCTPINADL